MRIHIHLALLSCVVTLGFGGLAAAEDRADQSTLLQPGDIYSVSGFCETNDLLKDAGDSDCTRSNSRVACCGDCGCKGSCCGGCYDPLWTVRADAIFLKLAQPDPAILVIDNGGAVLLNADEFAFSGRTGWGISLIRRDVIGKWGVEGRYYGVDDWSASRGVVNSSGAWVQFATPLGNGLPTDLSASYQSDLRNVEVNARRDIGNWGSFLVGFRYVDLNEHGLTILEDIGPGLNLATHAISANNHLAGAQIGFEPHIWSRGRLAVDGLLKAGVFSNDASNEVLITQQVTPMTFASAAARVNTAFVGELAFTGLYNLNDRWSVRAGYQLLWIEGVALASRQVAVSDPAYGLATLDNAGSPFYHGAFVGLEYRR